MLIGYFLKHHRKVLQTSGFYVLKIRIYKLRVNASQNVGASQNVLIQLLVWHLSVFKKKLNDHLYLYNCALL